MWKKILRKFRSWESDAEDVLSNRTPPHPQEMLTLILDLVEDKVTPLGDQRRGFPFTHLDLALWANDERRAYLEASYEQNEQLLQAVRKRLRDNGCQPPATLQIRFSYVSSDQPNWPRRWFHLEFLREIASAENRAFQIATITVTLGQSSQPSYQLDNPRRRYNLGRLDLVPDARGNPIRQNFICFLDNNTPVNSSVGREHAHIGFDAITQEWRIYADNRNSNTNILRNGGTINVVHGGLRGEKLQDDDEILCGQARLRFNLGVSA